MVVAVMRLYGVVDCLPELNDKISNYVSVVKGSEDEVTMRAATVFAIEQLVVTVGDDRINSQKLCNYFWS